MCSFGGIAAIMLYFVALSPLMSDNFVFSHEILPGYASFYAGENVTAHPLTVMGAFRQAWDMYFTWCGRFAGNLAAYLLFMLPRWLYCAAAACGFALYVFLLHLCIFGRAFKKNLTPGWLWALAAMLWLGLPSFGEAFLWLSVGGEVALMAQMAILLPFRFALDGPFARHSFSFSVFFCAALLLAGAFTASLDYAASVALAPTAICCIIFLWVKRGQFYPPLIFAATGLCLGAIFTLAAPGNAERLKLTQDEGVRSWLEATWAARIGDWFGHLPGLLLKGWLPLALLFCSWLIIRRGKWQIAGFPTAAALFLLPAIIVPISYIFTSWPPARAFNGAFAMLLVFSCIVFAKASQAANAQEQSAIKVGAGVLAALAIFICGHEAWKFYDLHKIDARREAALLNGSGIVELEKMPVGSGDRYWALGKFLYDISSDPASRINRGMALHYGVGEVRAKGDKLTFWHTANHEQPLVLATKNGRLEISFRKPDRGPLAGKIRLYYYGEPALLCALPADIGKKVLKWLESGEQTDLKKWLVPILLASADISVKSDGGGWISGKSQPLKLYENGFWLARPGGGIFDVLPLFEFQPNGNES